MSKLFKKLSIVVLSLVVLAGAVAPASAATTEELQAQIATLMAQITALNAQLSGTPATTPASSYTFTRNLTVGSRGADVTELQKFLVSGGYLTLATPTTYFGNATKAALAKYQAANGISPAVGYFGTLTRGKVNAATPAVPATPATPGTTPATPATPAVPAGTMGVTVDTMAGATLPKGASNVTVLAPKFSGNGTITALTFTRTGVGATTDFSNVYLYDAGKRLTTGRTINSQTHQVTFTGLNVKVEGSKTLQLGADVATGAATGNQHAFEITKASDVQADVTISGTPVKGATFTIGGQSVGSATITKTGSINNPSIGQKAAKLSEFKIEAGSTENITLNRVSLFYSGSLSRSNLSNFELKQAGTVVAKGTSITDKDLLVLTFDPAFKMDKGAVKTYELFGDIAGGTKSSETIKFYIDDASDLYAVGDQYGFGVSVTKTAFDSDTADHHVLTLQGGQVTISFNGPNASDVALRANDVVLLDFNIVAANNVEIRSIAFGATTTGLTSGEGFNDFKVRRQDNGAVLTSSSDVSTTTTVTFTDPINLTAGQTMRLQVVADVDADNDASDSIRVTLNGFGSSAIKNLDNNQFVATGDIVPNGVTGNLQTVVAADLQVTLNGQPSSQTVVAGATDVAWVAYNFRATGDTIKVTALTVDGSAASTTIATDLGSVALYDGATRVSDWEAINTTSKLATFDNLSITIPQGTQKTLTVRGPLSNSATNAAGYYFSASSTGVTAVDSNGNTLTLTFAAVNTGPTVIMTVGNPTLTFTKVVTTNSTDAGIVAANGVVALAEYDVYARNGASNVTKFNVGVNTISSSTATTTNLAQEVSEIQLFLGSTQVATAFPDASGAYAGIARFGDGVATLFSIPSNETKRLSIRAKLNDINLSTGASTGSNIYSFLVGTTTLEFKAVAGTQTLTDATGLGVAATIGSQKVMYKASPVFTKESGVDGATIFAGEQDVAKFRVNPTGTVSFKKMSFTMALSNATLTADSVKLYRDGTLLTVTATNATTGGASYIVLTTEDVVEPSSDPLKNIYTVKASVASLGTGSASITTSFLTTSDASVVTPIAYAATIGDMVWSDRSGQPHSETSTDWTNGKFVKDTSLTFTRSKS